MISLQWQDGVLSLLDQAAYPQQEHWITCSTVEETAQALSSGAILEEKIAAVAGVYGYCLAAMAHQELQQTPQFQEKLDQAKALLLASRPGSRELAAALDAGAPVDGALEEIKLRSRQYAKRQLTWLRRNPAIHWIYWEKGRDFARALQISTEILTASGLG